MSKVQETQAGMSRLKVFVSYSRRDVAFADQLVLFLQDRGYEAIIDRQSIHAAEEWRPRLSALIRTCDVVVFVLTEHPASSEVCAWEVEEAARRARRCIPVVPEPFDSNPPPGLAALNYIFFHSVEGMPGTGFYDGLNRLVAALETDLDWTRRHTRLGEQAHDWDAAERPEDRLLRGAALAEAQAWLDAAPAGADIQTLVRQFLNASADAELRREAAAAAQVAERERLAATAEARGRMIRRVGLSAVAGGVLLVALAALLSVFGLTMARQAEEGRALQFAAAVHERIEAGRTGEAVLLALHGDPAGEANWRTGLLRTERASAALDHALARAAFSDRLIWAHEVQPAPEGREDDLAVLREYILFPEGETGFALWRAGEDSPLARIDAEPDRWSRTLLAGDGTLLLRVASSGGEILVEPALGDGAHQSHRAPDIVQFEQVIVAHDGAGFAALSSDGRAFLWRLGEAEPAGGFDFGPEAKVKLFDVDLGRLALLAERDERLVSWRAGEVEPDFAYEPEPALSGVPWRTGFAAAAYGRDWTYRVIAGARNGNLTHLTAFNSVPIVSGLAPASVAYLRAAWAEVRRGRAATGMFLPIDHDIRVGPKGDHFLVSDDNGEIWYWRIGDPRPVGALMAPELEPTPASATEAEGPGGDWRRLAYHLAMTQVGGVVAASPAGRLRRWSPIDRRADHAAALDPTVRDLIDMENGVRFFADYGPNPLQETMRASRIISPDGESVPAPGALADLQTATIGEGGRFAAGFDGDGALLIVDAADGRTLDRRAVAAVDLVSFDASRSGERYAVLSRDGEIRVYQRGREGVLFGIQTGAGLAGLSSPLFEGRRNLVMDDAGGRLAIASKASGLTLYATPSGRPRVIEPADADANLSAAALSFEHDLAITGFNDGLIRVRSLDTAQVLQVLRAGSAVDALAVHPASPFFASLDSQGEVAIWRVGQAEPVLRQRTDFGHGRLRLNIHHFKFSSDGLVLDLVVELRAVGPVTADTEDATAWRRWRISDTLLISPADRAAQMCERLRRTGRTEFALDARERLQPLLATAPLTEPCPAP